ncbi:hypothetical protein GCM10018980_51900 [Streptomyces capoamus]|uniref:Tail assembly chaperone n=1 Tax=Streptomyces capoamus TaxID=68183 RepID=A0A919KE31_9ACTN|nr:hypothetical protein [Streptomyces capoamus]GGW15746.1 hypothetical protein GCM10010501_28910 [Streptomyces libani subsp. rufus]GHG62177.1 hypothetical protein GCM10018980_51900 [Streptomyces capoamus]
MASTPARTRQTTAARKRAAARPTVAPGDLGFEPIRIASDDEVPDERVPLFYIGDDEYTIPKHIPRGVALQYLRHAAEVGHEVATAPLLIRVLGEDAYMALEQSRALTQDQLDRIVEIIVEQALGKQEKEGKANRRG